jgi:hypothetical protein
LLTYHYNNSIATLRQVLQAGLKEKSGAVQENPASELKRVRVKQKHLQLPESSHFKSLVVNLRMRSGGWGLPDAAKTIYAQVNSDPNWPVAVAVGRETFECEPRGQTVQEIVSGVLETGSGQGPSGYRTWSVNPLYCLRQRQGRNTWVEEHGA